MATSFGAPTAAEWFGPSADRPTDVSARRVAEFFEGARRGWAPAHYCNPECYPEWMRSSLPQSVEASADRDTRGGGVR